MTEEQKKTREELEELIAKVKERIPKGSPEYLQAEKDIQPMFELNRAILEVVKNFKPFIEGQQGWVTLLLMALGRATSIILAGLDHIGATSMPAMEVYTNVILPMSELAESHNEAMKVATRKAKDTEEDKDVN